MKISNLLKSDQFKFIIFLIIITIWTYLIVFWYSYIFEQNKMTIDKYNFEQLEKVRNILDWSEKLKHFNTLKEFNEKYNIDIRPKKKLLLCKKF